MTAELQLNRSKRKIDISVVGADDKFLFIDVPKMNNEYISFIENETLFLTYYYKNLIFLVDSCFDSVENIEGNIYYKLSINNINHHQNYRKDDRKNVDISSIIFHSDNCSFSKIVDISQNGAKIECSKKLDTDSIILFYEKNGKEIWQKASIAWSKSGDECFSYGVYFER